MRNEDNAIVIYDAALILFAIIAAWFLIFQSGIF